MLINWYRFSSPVSFFPLAGSGSYAFGILAALFAGAGLFVALFVAPTDATQGDAYRIIYLHVPAAWMAMFIYLVMAGWSAFALGFNTRLSGMMAQALAPTGAVMAALALWTGAFWGRPTWGTYWAWDARMTSTLILLFLYLGVIALRNAIEDPRRADRACALLALVGAINVPVIYFSVQWWNTLHQGSSIGLTVAPKMAMTMLAGILVMTAAAWCYTIAITLARMQAIIIERERGAGWLESLIDLNPPSGAPRSRAVGGRGSLR